MASFDTSDGTPENGSPRTHVHSGPELGEAELALHFWPGEGVEFSTP